VRVTGRNSPPAPRRRTRNRAGIPETEASLDARLIVDAAGRSVQLWPEGGR